MKSRNALGATPDASDWSIGELSIRLGGIIDGSALPGFVEMRRQQTQAMRPWRTWLGGQIPRGVALLSFVFIISLQICDIHS